MSSKAYRKLAKEKEQDQMKKLVSEGNIPAKTSIPMNQSKNLFAGFQMEQSSSEEEQPEKEEMTPNEAEEKKPDEKKGGGQKEALSEAERKEAAKKKRKNKKANKKKKTLEDVIAEDEEKEEEEAEIDLSELAPNNSLEINQRVFNYNKELDRFFKGMKPEEDADITSMSKREKAYLKMMQTKHKTYKHYTLCQNKDIFEALPDRLLCEFIKVNQQGHKVFAFKPTPRFNSIGETYENIRNTHDPNAMFQFVQVNPFFPEALYDCGEFLRLQGNFKEANKMLERILFLYEDSFSYDFKIFDNSLANICTLDYDYNQYTKIFFKTIFKFIAILTKRGCYQAALEYNKVLLKLSPVKDPLGSFLYIDHNAISAKKFDFIEDFARNFASQYLSEGTDTGKSIIMYPNVIYSLSLSKFYKVLDDAYDNKLNPNDILTKIEADLIENINNLKIDYKRSHNFWGCLSIILFPKMMIKILQETELTKMQASHSSFVGWQKKPWSEIFEHKFLMRTEHDYMYHFLQMGNDQDVEGLEKVIAIYAVRNKLLWKNKFINVWLKAIVGALLNAIETGSINEDKLLETILLPPSEGDKGPFTPYHLPFEPKIHMRLVIKDFSDAEDNLDLNNIRDEQAGPANPHAGNNPIDPNQNWLNLLLGSLMPWNDLPAQQNQQHLQDYEEEDFD